LCLAECDPLGRDCGDELCVPTGDTFACVPANADLAPGEPCTLLDDCASGTACIPPEYVPECVDDGCCSSFCDLTAPDPAAGCLPAQTCQPWYDPGAGPPSLMHVGVCALR
jgi:hypothetical protein